ncbi:hypothetical protein XFEB_00997, partial [Xylella fastidiosa EB92.1]
MPLHHGHDGVSLSSIPQPCGDHGCPTLAACPHAATQRTCAAHCSYAKRHASVWLSKSRTVSTRGNGGSSHGCNKPCGGAI